MEQSQNRLESQMATVMSEMELVRQELEQVRQESLTDGLTGIANRKALIPPWSGSCKVLRSKTSLPVYC